MRFARDELYIPLLKPISRNQTKGLLNCQKTIS